MNPLLINKQINAEITDIIVSIPQSTKNEINTKIQLLIKHIQKNRDHLNQDVQSNLSNLERALAGKQFTVMSKTIKWLSSSLTPSQSKDVVPEARAKKPVPASSPAPSAVGLFF